MKLVDALQILRQPSTEAQPFEVELVCGFTPLHLETYLGAHVQLLLPQGNRISMRRGLYGDIAGNLRRLKTSPISAAAMILEWADLDPRLGVRNLGGWGVDSIGDILSHAKAKASECAEAVRQLPPHLQLAVLMPTLPLPPADTVPGWQSGVFELSLRAIAASLAAEFALRRNTRVVSAQKIDEVSPLHGRFDARSEILGGFPYTAAHSVAVAGQLARLLVPAAPMKGIITDLDDTMWNGLVGEVGASGVYWDLDHKSVIHGLYQQMLNALAAQGTLIGVASKNTASIAEEALKREDFLIPRDRLFPLEIHWGPKSQSVERILKQWNIGADSVVFIDDNAAELAEVQAAHPGITCLQFPKNDAAKALALIEQLRDKFGKETVSEEDRLRVESLRQASTNGFSVEGAGPLSESFLEKAQAELRLGYGKDPSDPRPFELINKTNQFNLNGRRLTEAAWRERLADPDTVLQVASYSDKFGALGKIGVVLGHLREGVLDVECWVLSCRAFSRRIEHQCLSQLFSRLGVRAIRFDFAPTEKNQPLRDFFTDWFGDPLPANPELTAEAFAAGVPRLYHRVNSEP